MTTEFMAGFALGALGANIVWLLILGAVLLKGR